MDNHDKKAELLNDFSKLVDNLEKLIEGHDVDTIIPALTFVLGTVLAESGQDKNGSLEFVINSVIKLYEMHANEENENE